MQNDLSAELKFLRKCNQHFKYDSLQDKRSNDNIKFLIQELFGIDLDKEPKKIINNIKNNLGQVEEFETEIHNKDTEKIIDFKDGGQSGKIEKLTNLCIATGIITQHFSLSHKAAGIEKGDKINSIIFKGSGLGGALAQYNNIVAHNDEYQYKTLTLNSIGIEKFAKFQGHEFLGYKYGLLYYLNDLFENDRYLESLRIELIERGVLENGNISKKYRFSSGDKIDPVSLKLDLIDIYANLYKENNENESIFNNVNDIEKTIEKSFNPALIERKMNFIDEYREYDRNSSQENNIANYLMSTNFSGRVLGHIGGTYIVDKDFKTQDSISDEFLEKIKNIKKEAQLKKLCQTTPEVFPPFVLQEKEGNGKWAENRLGEEPEIGQITNNISKDYLKTVVKDIILEIKEKDSSLIKEIFKDSRKRNGENIIKLIQDRMHHSMSLKGLIKESELEYESSFLQENGDLYTDSDKIYLLDHAIIEQFKHRMRYYQIRKLWDWILSGDGIFIQLGKELEEEEEPIEYQLSPEAEKVSNEQEDIEIEVEAPSQNVILGSKADNPKYSEERDKEYRVKEDQAYNFSSKKGAGFPILTSIMDVGKKVKVDGSDISGTYKEKKAEEVDIGDRESSAGDRYFGDNIIYKESQNKLLYLYGSEKKNELVIDGFKNGDYGIELKDMVPGEAKDKLKTYGDYYKLKFNELEFKSLDKLEVKKGINQHTEVNIAGQVEAEKYQETREYLDKDFTPLYITYKEEDTNILFKGRLVEYDFYREEGGDAYLEARALSNSLKLKRDYESLAIDKQDRVYQVVGSTYTDIMDMIMEAHEKVDIKFQKSETGEETFLKEEHPVEMQYHENDWHFLKRVFSEYGKKGIPILVDDTKAEDEPVNIKIGFSKGESIKLSKEVYKQHRKGKLEKRDSGCGKQDGLYSSLQIDKFQHGKFSKKDRKKELLGVGKTVEIETGDGEKKEYKVIENRLYIPEDGFTLRSDLTLVEPKKLHMEKVKRERDIEGIAASAKVKKVKKDHTLQVKFEEMESEHNSDVYSYPIDKFYTGEYFAPEKGDIVDIYFGGKNEKDATVKSIRTSVKTINNPPKVKKIRTQEGKEIVIDDEDKSITFSGKDDEVNMYITEELIHFMRKDTKIIMKDDGIILRAGDREITISEDGLIARADGNKLGMIENCIIMENQSGAFVEVKDGKIKITDGQSKITMGDGDISINSAAMAKLG